MLLFFLITRDSDVLQYWKKNTFLSNSFETSLSFAVFPYCYTRSGGENKEKKEKQSNKNILDGLMWV